MNNRGLTRRAGGSGPPVRLLHMGLGNFFRAHQACYTDRAADADGWGIAAFTGTMPGTTQLVSDLQSQGGLYTLVERGPERDQLQVIRSLTHVHPAADDEAWLGYWRSPALSAVTITITEAGYAGDALRRLLAGLEARQRADAGPMALVPCDNLAGNGGLLKNRLYGLAGDGLLPWLEESVSVVSTMVDRITPRVTDADRTSVLGQSDYDDRCPVVTEPYSEWVLAGDFPAGRPRWETAGATFADDVTPYEDRKLWLLNGAHSLLAYAGSIRGHTTVAQAVDDAVCRQWLIQWWATASRHLPESGLAAYRESLLERFGNRRMQDLLARIAADGSQKLPIRIVPVLREERKAGRSGAAATRAIAAWICHLQGLGAPVQDVAADAVRHLARGQDPVEKLLDHLEPGLGDDAAVVVVVAAQCAELRGRLGS